MKLNTILITGFLCISLILIATIGTLSFTNSKVVVEEEISQYLETTSESRANHIKTFMDSMKNRMVGFSSDGKIKDCLYDIQHKNLEGCTREELTQHLIKNKLPTLHHSSEVFLMDVNGSIIAATSPSSVGLNRKDNAYFIYGKEKPFIKDIYFSETVQQTIMVVSVPVIIGFSPSP